ncbi:MAG TPA: hypothetical protein PKI77_20275, partial [Mycobacterium sp.]|nr:hypothetical protein [Mycobacterium sp.]
ASNPFFAASEQLTSMTAGPAERIPGTLGTVTDSPETIEITPSSSAQSIGGGGRDAGNEGYGVDGTAHGKEGTEPGSSTVAGHTKTSSGSSYDRNSGHPSEPPQAENTHHAQNSGVADAGPEVSLSPYETETPGFLTDEQRDAILAMDKGLRPDPSDYLPAEFIVKHLERFNEGATRFMTADNLDAFGIGQRDGTTFVFPKNELDKLMGATGGDRALLEQALGLPPGYFATYEIVRVDIPNPENYGIRMPSGNEAGANDQWFPGGFLPTGMPEAIIDGVKVPQDGYLTQKVAELSDEIRASDAVQK